MTAAFNAKIAALTVAAERTAPYSRNHHTGHCYCARCKHIRAHIAKSLHAEGGWTWLAIGAAIGTSGETAQRLVRGRRKTQTTQPEAAA
jgi:hypothetical protein